MPNRIAFNPAGHGQRLNTVDSTATVKIDAADTSDAYELFEVDAPEGPGVPPHRHPWAEAYYVLEGHLRVQVGQQRYDLEPGSSITVPPNAIHATEADGGSCRFLAFSLSAGTGLLFADLDRSVDPSRPMDELVPVILAVAERNGVSFVGAPPA